MILESLSDEELNQLYINLNSEFQRRYGIALHKDKPIFKENIDKLPEGLDLMKYLKDKGIKPIYFPGPSF